jgi:predicted nucleic acid-binding protein
MVVVDTTVWADWFNGTGAAEVARLDRALTAGDVGCIIAQTCIAAEAELLTADRDFVAIARHSRLRLAAVER